MIELQAIVKRFSNNLILSQLNLTVETATTVIMGPSGSGKSTLLRIISGLLRPDAGIVKIDGQIVDDTKRYIQPYQRRLGFMFQNAALWPHLNVAENVGFGLLSWEKRQRQQRIAEVIDQVGMNDHCNKFPYQLSGGQARRVSLARSLAPNPGYLLLDEPLSNLDDSARFELLLLIKQVAKDINQSIVYVTHRHDEAAELGGKQYYLDKGILTSHEEN